MSGRKIHFIGIGGVGMAALAVLLKRRGNDVSGCDLSASPRTEWLESLGIPVAIGHDPEHVRTSDEVIVTPAVRPDNPELRAARNVRCRGDVLAELVSDCDSVAVCGSHGKTTTATFAAKLLRALGEDVGWAIGGETGDFPVAGFSTQTPKNPNNPNTVLIVEADESDGTLAKYRARTLVVTNCEYDHPDHFKTFADYCACYDAARRQAGDVIESETLKPIPEIEAFGLARHNTKNARAAAEVALRRGHSLESILAVLPDVVKALPDRRFQQIWPSASPESRAPNPDLLVYTDYAHHPTEMRCAVEMARHICRGTLRVLFQPHRYSRTKALLNDFPSSFNGSDEVVLCPTYAAFESPIEGGDIADLYAACRALTGETPRFMLARSCAEAWEHARNSMKPGDLTLLLGAGNIIGLVPQIQHDLSLSTSHIPHPSQILIGQGSNTLKSDLNLSVEYVKTEGPAGQSGAALLAAHPTLCPWMAGIPGTVGGWIKMNAGAFGHSFSEALEAVKADGAWLSKEQCGFGYRTSAIAGEIQDFRLAPDPATAEKTPAEYLAERKSFPPNTRGSVFKNPEGDSAGRLLEAAGCKGLRVGGAVVWTEHANVIVLEKGAQSSDFLALARLMRNRVFFKFGLNLEPEVRGLEF